MSSTIIEAGAAKGVSPYLTPYLGHESNQTVSGIMSGKMSGKIPAAVGRQPGIAVPELAELIGVREKILGAQGL